MYYVFWTRYGHQLLLFCPLFAGDNRHMADGMEDSRTLLTDDEMLFQWLVPRHIRAVLASEAELVLPFLVQRESHEVGAVLRLFRLLRSARR